jgi:NHLM bacteriocin system ABC transporter ATP-binding protein
MISKFIFNEVIPSGTSDSLFGVVVLLLGATIVSELFSLSRTIWITRIGNKIEIRGQNAVWARVLNLPVDFFGKYEAGEMTRRAESIDEICSILGGQLIPSILGSLFSVLYLFQIAGIASSLLLPSLLIIICMLGFAFLDTKLQIDYMQESNRAENKLNSFVFQILGGITKIKLTGAEIRAFSKWSDLYAKLPLIPKAAMRLSGTINRVITILGTMLLYWMAYNTQMSASDYIAFQSAFGSFCAAIMMLTNVTRQIASLKPSLEMLRPIIEEKPENCTGQVRLDELSGEIELHQIKFRYQPDMPLVLDDLSVHIKAGEYIGVVGSSGSGKSTMMRLLLGFEHPESGSVYYDGKDLAGLDLHSLRQKMGVVLQNGKLFLGDIYSNIVVNAPWLTVDDAWAAAEAAGFAEDIRKMPMGMFTMLSEEGGGLSGGQKQRLLIARALAADPDILIFDEATSALDNITQAMVVKTLEKRKGTRIVIAHRLSTIMNCSRILYLHQGKIAEEGTYEELMEKKGRFYEMAKRQLA